MDNKCIIKVVENINSYILVEKYKNFTDKYLKLLYAERDKL